MSDGLSPRERREARRRASRSGEPPPSTRKNETRVPAWVVVPLAGAAGFFTAQWPGLLLGLAIGGFLWRMRR